MTAKIIDGILLAKSIKNDLKTHIAKLSARPKLAVVLIGSDPASAVYVANKQKACEECGIESLSIKHPDTITETELEEIIIKLNNDKSVNGILVQLPLPQHIDKNKIINLISPQKDVDGFCATNIGNIFSEMSFNEMLLNTLLPCTPKGCLYALSSVFDLTTSKPLAGLNICVIGASNIVGKPVANMLINLGGTVSICNSKTKNVVQYTKTADIIIAAAGRPNLITGEMLKNDAILIDVGINRIFDTELNKHKLVGDIDFKTASQVASHITPVPGGIGPLTIAFLMYNTLCAFKIQNNI